MTNNEAPKKTSAQRRAKLLAQLRDMFADVEEGYAEFLAEAKASLPDVAQDERFPFIVRRLWMESFDDIGHDWQACLRRDYDAFAADFEWTAPGHDEGMVAKTLSVWQKRYLVRLDAKKAARMIEQVEELGRAIGMGADDG